MEGLMFIPAGLVPACMPPAKLAPQQAAFRPRDRTKRIPLQTKQAWWRSREKKAHEIRQAAMVLQLPGLCKPRQAAAADPVVTREREDGGFELSLSTPVAGLLRSVHFARGTPVQFAAIIPGDGVAEAVLTSGLSNFLQLYNAALICRLVLTWFPNPPQAIVSPLATVVDPYLNLFRGIIPPISGIDLSPILAFVVLDLFTNSAAALPAELDEQGQLKVPSRSSGPVAGLTAWKRRMEATAERRRQQREQQQ